MADRGFGAMGCALQAIPGLILHPATHLGAPIGRLLDSSDNRHKLTLDVLYMLLPVIAGPLPLDELHTRERGRDLRQDLLGKVLSQDISNVPMNLSGDWMNTTSG